MILKAAMRRNKIQDCLKILSAIVMASCLVLFFRCNGHRSRLQETTFPAIQDTKKIKVNISEVPFITSRPYVMSNTNICRSSEELTLIMLIHSAPSHFGHRSVIRNTWANINNFHVKFNFRRVFLFGKVSNHELQARLEDEHMIHGDILQGDFNDGYRNLSLNTLFGLAWVYEHCSNAEVVMKVDDDIVVDMYNLFPRMVMRMSFVTNHVFCNRLHNEPIERNKHLKYFVSENELKGKSVFPPYCEGKVVIFTSDLVHQILNVASNTPVFWLEDVYMYGLVLNQIPNLTFDIYKFGDEMDIWCDDTTKCVTTDSACRKLFVEIRKPILTLIENIWKMFQQRHVSCAVL